MAIFHGISFPQRRRKRKSPISRRLMIECVEQRQLLATVLGVELHAHIDDSEDLPKGAQPTSWQQQRSDIRSIQVRFSAPIQDVAATDLVLTLSADPSDFVIPLTDTQLTTEDDTLYIAFEPQELADGAYTLEILPSVIDTNDAPLDGDGDGVNGDSYYLQGNLVNGFFKLTADWNGDGGVSIFDFPTFAYWFGVSTAQAPAYTDLNQDGGVSIHDFTVFAANFGRSIGESNCSTTEAQQLAVEVSGSLLPPFRLTKAICTDLHDIRSAYPEVSSIAYRPTWGSSLIVTVIDEAIEQYDQGTYHDLDSLNEQFDATEVTKLSFGPSILISFSDIYNMPLLSELYAREVSVVSAQPTELFGDGDDITASPPIYVLTHGFGDCPSGCIFKETWTFSVENGDVSLLSHSTR
jgi:hypothetical protein